MSPVDFTQRPPMIMTDTSLSVFLHDQQYTADSSHPKWDEIVEAVREEDWENLPVLMNIPQAVTQWANGKFEVRGNELFFDDEPVVGTIQDRILTMMDNGVNPDYLLRFYERLQNNPSNRSVSELYDFLEHSNIPIGEDGCFYAYKSVKTDFTDHHTGTFDNRPGTVNEMPRNKVDDERHHACSHGFHVGALEYAKNFGSHEKKLVVVKVDPADVVSVPRDSSAQKVRVCKYEVVEHYGAALPDDFYVPGQLTEDDLGDPEEYYDYEDDDPLF